MEIDGWGEGELKISSCFVGCKPCVVLSFDVDAPEEGLGIILTMEGAQRVGEVLLQWVRKQVSKN